MRYMASAVCVKSRKGHNYVHVYVRAYTRKYVCTHVCMYVPVGLCIMYVYYVCMHASRYVRT